MDITDDRWAIYIDIQGFSHFWERDKNKALCGLNHMMEAIVRIGEKVCSVEGDRFFAHHIGDGFFVISEFHENKLERAITIAVALMKYISKSGIFAKAAIAEGDNADITSCYPKDIQDSLNDDGCSISLGAGVMTIFPVMGTALVRAHELAKNSPQGPMLTIKASEKERIPKHIKVRCIKENCVKLLMVDWVHMKSELLEEIQNKACLPMTTSKKIEKRLVQYCNTNCLSKDWIDNVSKFLNVHGIMEDC